MLNLGGVVGGLKILQNFAVRVMGVTQLGIEPPLLFIVSIVTYIALHSFNWLVTSETSLSSYFSLSQLF